MEDHSFSSKDPVSIINFLTEFKRACDLSHYQEGAAVWLFPDFMTGSALSTIKVRLELSSKDVNVHNGTTTSNTGVVNHLLRCHATDAVMPKGDDEIRNLKQRSWTLRDFSQRVWDFTLRCEAVYNKQTLRGFFTEGFVLAILSIMWHWWANNREATLEGLAHLAKFLLNLQAVTQKISEKENPVNHTEYCVRHENNKNHRIMVVQSSDTP